MILSLPKYIHIAFDTTNVMSGRHNVMCVQIQRPLIWMPCRHHVSELLLKEACVKMFKFVSNSSEVPVLKKKW